MKEDEYFLIVRTGGAEIRALENTEKDVLQQIIPVIELTRGRKKTVGNVVTYPFENKLNKFKEIFRNQRVVLDVTSDEKLECIETNAFYDSENGYNNWVNFLQSLDEEHTFMEIIPTILMNFEDKNFEANLASQIEKFCDIFGVLAYRCSIEEEYCYDDLNLIKESLDSNSTLYVIIDCGYTAQAMQNNYIDKCKARIKNISNLLSGMNYHLVLCATSFPNNVSEIGSDDYDEFSSCEQHIYESCKEEYPNLIYGDYGSINPVRNDQIVMARGWIPRIDVPIGKTIYYYRKRRPKGVTAYSSTYKEVAKMVVEDSKFPYHLPCWGIAQIKACASSNVPSSAPSFWISVRMNIYLCQRVRSLLNLSQ